MSFVNVSLLALGGLFVAVPIVLHLAMRQKPKEQIFPALRFLKQRQETNRRRLRLRQALLLLLRCLMILLLALALARPSVASVQMGHWLVTSGLALLLLIVILLIVMAVAYRRGWPLLACLALMAMALAVGLVSSSLAIARNKPPILLGQQRASVAAVILIDTSPRMQLRYQNQSRLERGQDVARWLLGQFPRDSQVAIVDRVPAGFSVDIGAAESAVDALDTTYVAQTWRRRITESLELLKQSDKARKELYLLTDLTRATWRSVAAEGELSERLRESPEVIVQVIDLGVEDPSNVAVADVQLSQSSLTPGSPLTVRARLSRQGGEGESSARLFVEDSSTDLPLVVDGELRAPPVSVRGRSAVKLTEGQDQWVTFPIPSLPYGTHHGYVELESSDALVADDRRSFTVHVRRPWPVLIVAGAGSDPRLVTERLAPREFRETERAKFDCRVVNEQDLSSIELKDYAAVTFLDPAPLSDLVWQQIKRYVERGGGVALMLGRNADRASRFNSPASGDVVPSPIDRIWVDQQGLTVAPRDYDHPVVSVMRDYAATIPWESMPIFRHWVVGPLHDQSRVILEVSNNKPLLLERQIGKGRVLLLTTPAADPDVRRRPPWNLLPSGAESWPFMILMDRMVQYLAHTSDAQLNYTVGQTARLPADVGPGERLTVLTPRSTFQEVTVDATAVQIPFADVPGIYRLRLDATSTVPRGFSVNLSPSATRLDRLLPDELESRLGKDRFRVAITEDEIVREIDQARIGKEFYPFLLPLLAFVMALEYVIANRFYPRPKAQPAASIAA